MYVAELTDLKLASETPQIAQISHLVEIRATFGPTNCQQRRFIEERVFYKILQNWVNWKLGANGPDLQL